MAGPNLEIYILVNIISGILKKLLIPITGMVSLSRKNLSKNMKRNMEKIAVILKTMSSN